MAREKGERKTYGFTKHNLWILLASLALIILGYILLSGAKSSDGISFDPEVFNVVRTSIAPALLALGYLGVLVAIIWKPKEPQTGESEE